eukprot:TRINITY_DN2143_c0_g1_i1.p1 TRINITY_DN2143_c0_g1~~TRINITY_DN2143_c0_g1_i1.p1  ORF type:complete len:750 (-),score=144.10 TRINITY_DN2143_c0_g1_i1:189-2261(-)
MVGYPQWIDNTSYVFVETGQGVFYRSTNGGLDWTSLQPQFKAPVTRLTQTADPKVLLALSSTVAGRLWQSRDYGATWSYNDNSVIFAHLLPHPRIPGLVAAFAHSTGCYTRQTPCFLSVHVSSNNQFNDWYELTRYTGVHISWGVHPGILDVNIIQPDTLFVTEFSAQAKSSGRGTAYDLQLVKYSSVKNKLDTKTDIVLDHCPGFFIIDNIIFAAYLPKPRVPVIALYVSRDGATTPLKLVQFPYDAEQMTASSFSLLDISEGTTFIHSVDGSKEFAPTDIRYGTLFQSDAVDQVFNTALEQNVVGQNGQVDFVRLSVVDGIFIANQLNADGGIETVISFDGAEAWHRIPAPQGSECRTKGSGCYLNLYGLSSGKIPFYSLPSAIGVLIATGNVGPELDTSTTAIDHVYVSVDGGVSWRIVKDGSWTYEFGDHGAILILAQNDVPTDEILFSWNQGTTWNNCTFGSRKLRMENIMSGSGPLYGSSTEFLAYSRNPETDTTVLVHFDFGGLHERECEESDYEYWTPQDPYETNNGGRGCILGKSVSYKRRKSERECHNGLDFTREDKVKFCNCEDEDFACDYCYKRSNTNSTTLTCELSEQCIRAKWRPSVEGAPTPCNGTFNMTKGYRKIEGDKCIDTDDTVRRFGKVATRCPDRTPTAVSSGGGAAWGVAVVMYLFLAVERRRSTNAM